ncbi:hypothetical protein CHH57_02180 [Niallia circulans]|uniref:Thymidylate kinase-like domain-containing protein n=1 Tax=Niallia circulans TaxID=1397 RepID=A0AA91Z2T3_NIACI|nr:deoxynucleoside kinase [Niallia circulans]PAD84860.1 hypothetical protein CHH57_02180 [Niallia circulans]
MEMIILEGNECCFKSTVASKLNEKLDYPIIKGSSFELAQCNNEELYKHFIEFAKNKNVIMDRFIYSNQVYATLYKDYAILTDTQRKSIEEMVFDKAKVYYLYAPDEVIKKRIKSRGDEYVELDMVSKISEMYEQVMFQSGLKLRMLDTNEMTSDEIVEVILADI